MGKRFWAITIKRNVVAFVIVFSAGVLFDFFSSYPESRNPMAAGGVAVLVYLVASIVFGLMNLISNLVYMWLFNEKDLEGAILDDLRITRLPAPSRYQSKSFDYLAEAMDDDELSTENRIKAAYLGGCYKTAMERGIFIGLIFRRAADKAFMQYAREAPERRRSRPIAERDV